MPLAMMRWFESRMAEINYRTFFDLVEGESGFVSRFDVEYRGGSLL